jgi:hypothetical protein
MRSISDRRKGECRLGLDCGLILLEELVRLDNSIVSLDGFRFIMAYKDITMESLILAQDER